MAEGSTVDFAGRCAGAAVAPACAALKSVLATGLRGGPLTVPDLHRRTGVSCRGPRRRPTGRHTQT